MFSRLREVSVTSSVLVRTSIATVPRSESRAARALAVAAAAPAPVPAEPPRIRAARSDAFA